MEQSREIIAGDTVQLITKSHMYQGVVDFVDKDTQMLGMRSGFYMTEHKTTDEEPTVFNVSKGNDAPWEIAFTNILKLMLIEPASSQVSEKAVPVPQL